MRCTITKPPRGLASLWLGMALLLAPLLVSPQAFAQVSLSIADLTVEAGASDVAVASITTDGTAVALQFDVLYDPAIVSVGTVNPGSALTLNHTIASNPIGAGRDRVVITSTPVTALNGGVLADINFTINGSAVAGTTSLAWDAVVIGDASALSITPASLTDGVITITVAAAPPPPPPPTPVPTSEPVIVPASPFWSLGILALLMLGMTGRLGRALPMGVRSAALVLCLLPVATPLYAQNPIPGDANNDGVIDGQDVQLIVEQILELGVVPGDADCNEDGQVNVLDTICSQQAFVPGDTTPIILGPGDRSIPAGIPFEMVLFAADPDENAALSWELLSGPAGLTVSADGVLTWTPTTADLGDNPVSVRVTDETDREADASFTITVFTDPTPTSSNGPPVLNAPGNQSLPVGTPLAAQASATDPDVGDVLTYSLVNAPAGMSINASTGVISWTPQANQAEAADVVVKVTDSAGNSDFGSFIVTASALNEAPVANDDIYIARKGETLTVPAPEGVILNDEDPNDDPLSATRLTDPTKGTLDAFNGDGSFSYTPVEPTPITIGLVEKCRTEARVSAGTMSAADVDNDGVVELVNLVGGGRNSLFSNVFVVDGRDCTTESNATVPEFVGAALNANASTLVNLDDDPELEVVGQYFRFNDTEGNDERLYALNLDGTPLENWPAHGLSEANSYATALNSGHALSGPVAADLDGDGDPELITGLTNVNFDLTVQNTTRNLVVAYDGRTGAVLWEFLGDITRSIQRSATPTIVDLDLDGDTEIIWNHHVLDHEGNLVFDLPVEQTIPNGGSDFLTVAIANFDNDAFPEIIAYDATHLTLYSHDGQIQWQIERANGGFGFPWTDITIAELDGDPFPEFVSMLPPDGGGGLTLYAFDSDGQELWEQGSLDFVVQTFAQTRNSSPVAFDFDSDGIDELIQFKGQMTGDNDPGLYIFDGRDGTVIDYQPMGPQNNQDETLTVADVDGDGFAEIITNDNTEFGSDTVQIWDNLPDNPFPAAPKYRSGTNYQTSWFGEDASLPTSLPPFWLEPGQNGWNMIQPPADPLNPERDSFTYRVSDGAVDSNTATVNIEIQPQGNPPSFISEPGRGISRGVAYVYEPLVIDIDPGDVVTFELVAGPAGMTIDAQTGRLDWFPDNAGDFPVSIVASDTMGFSAAQIFNISVGDPVIVPDVVGATEANAETTLTNDNLAKGDVFLRSHPTIPAGIVISQSPMAGAAVDFGAPVDLTVSIGAGIFDRDDDGDGFSENEGDCDDGSDSIFPGAPDANGDGIDQDCDGLDGNKTLVAIELTPNSKRVLTNAPTPIVAMGIFEDGTAQNITSLATWVNGPTFSSGTSGSFVAEASFRGITGTANFDVVDRVVEDLAPQARITSPGNGDTVTAPVDVVVIATDNNLLRWELDYRYAGEEDFVPLAEGTTSRSNQPSAEFDTTTLLNGLYTIRLRVYDRGGNVSEDSTVVQVEGPFKVGNFTLSFTDVDVPMAGVPIRVTRTYDSRDKRQGDFGIGWTLDVKSIRLQTSRVLGSGWRVLRSGLTYALVPTDVHIVSLVFPDGREEQFDMVVTPNISPVIPFPPLTQTISYRPRAGTLGQLESLDDNNISILDAQPGPVDLRLDNGGAVYDPSLFRYTSADGTQVVIDRVEGVRNITDPNGNTLTIADNGITHSAGKSVSFTRDSAGRITQITDPAGNTQAYSYDANGDLRSHLDEEGNTTRFDYNAYHGLLRVVDPLDRVQVRNEYDANGRLVKATNADGRVIELSHDPSNRQEIVTDADGGITLLEFDDRGNVVRATDALGNVITSTYDDQDNQLSRTDALGDTTTRTFDARDNLLTETDALGNTATYVYDGKDRVSSITDALGRVTSFTYDSRGNLLTETDASGSTTTYTYDGAGNRIAQTDALGNTTEYRYDGFGNKVSQTDARGNTELFTYDANGKLLTHTDKRGNVTANQLDGRGFVVRATDALGNASTLVRDSLGNLIETVDPLGNRSVTVVDALGNEAAYISPAGEQFGRDYDVKGNLVQVSSETGSTARFSYDLLDRVTGTIDANGDSTAMAFDSNGRLTQQRDQKGNVTQFFYDAAGRQTRAVNSLGHEINFTYDDVGNLVSRTDAKGNVWSYTYDALNRQIRETYPDGTATHVEYDSLGRVRKRIDALGREVTTEYDAEGNVVSITDPLGNVTRFAYDEEGNRVTREDAKGRVTNHEYDAKNRLVKEILPDGTFYAWVYDAAGNQISHRDANGDTTSYEYDANGRKVRKTLADGAEVTYSYTASNNLATVTDSRGQTSYRYDTNNRLIGVTNPDGSALAYSYDAAGLVTAMEAVSPDGTSRVTAYSYDALNRLTRVTDAQGETTVYGYDENGNLASVTNGNGVTTDYAYDPLNRLVQITHRNGASLLEEFRYTLDAVGNRTRVDQTDGSNTEYIYDELNRLLRETQRNGSGIVTLDNSYTYDEVGNRLTLRNEINGSLTNYTYDTGDRLLAAGSTRYAYDANGNTTGRGTLFGTTYYGYDKENRLVSINDGAVATFTYDAMGNRVATTTAGGTEHYLVDGMNPTSYAQAILEYDDVGELRADYTFGLDLISQHRSGSHTYYHYDGINSTRLLTNASGQVTDRYDYEAYGSLIARSGVSVNPHLFTGERLDASSSLYYLRARYYVPDSGRFMSRDPFRGFDRDPQSLHRYAYVNNNPVNLIDYSGLYTISNTTAAVTIGSSLITLFAIAYGDTRDEANYQPGRIAYRIVTSAILAAISAGYSGTAATAAAAGEGGLIVVTASQILRQTMRFAVQFGMRSLGVATASTVICLGEGAGFGDASRGAAIECAFKGVVTGVVFAIVGSADAVRAFQGLNTVNFSGPISTFLLDVVLNNVVNTISAIVETWIGEELPTAEAIDRFLNSIGVDEEDEETVRVALRSY